MPAKSFQRQSRSCPDLRIVDRGLQPRRCPSEPCDLNNKACSSKEGSKPCLQFLDIFKDSSIPPVMRWDGFIREASPWSCLEKDPELFNEDANCAIHFYARGESQCGPSLKVSREAMIRAGCSSLFETQIGFGTAFSADIGHSSTGGDDEAVGLYIPAPNNLSKMDALSHHMTTRNLFAWIMEKPLVGFSLGQAMINLLERMFQVRPVSEDNLDDCVAYAERMGYLYMTNQPEYAFAMLAFAENAGHDSIRKNAFVHCVGMNDMLYRSLDANMISLHTQIAILEEATLMDTKVECVIGALPGFFEGEAEIDLGPAASLQEQLQQFRSFLYDHYTFGYGSWPLAQYTPEVLNDIRFDFECLFELLVHRAQSPQQSVTMLEGLSVLQKVNAFDRRHGFSPLESALPLLPSSIIEDGRTLSAWRFKKSRRFKGARHLKTKIQTSLQEATNKGIPKVMACRLVTSYLEFEHNSITQVEAGPAIADARKVRWIQIYYTLQMLKSITESALEATVADVPAYYTCCTIPPLLELANIGSFAPRPQHWSWCSLTSHSPLAALDIQQHVGVHLTLPKPRSDSLTINERCSRSRSSSMTSASEYSSDRESIGGKYSPATPVQEDRQGWFYNCGQDDGTMAAVAGEESKQGMEHEVMNQHPPRRLTWRL